MIAKTNAIDATSVLLLFVSIELFIVRFLFTDPNLCSHIWSVCYLSQSIFDHSLMNAEPCTRRCPVGMRNLRNNRIQFRQNVGFGIPMGQHTPME